MKTSTEQANGGCHLARFRAGFPACEVVALADIDKETILAWDAALKLPQEKLDDLVYMARDALDGPKLADRAILVTPTGQFAFLRRPGIEEVLCAVFAREADIGGAMTQGAALLGEVQS